MSNNKDGKLDHRQLKEQFITKLGYCRKEVLQGPAIGVDVAIIQIDDSTGLVVASDPLSIIPTLPMEISAWLSVHLMANDIATSGFLPSFGQFVLNLPTSLSAEQAADYWNYVHVYCKEIGIHITGGHTAFDSFTQSTLAGGGTLFSIAPLDGIKTSAMAQIDDDLIMTKTAAFSSSAILALSFPHYIKKELGEEVLQKAKENFFRTSIIPEVKLLRQHKNLFQEINAMHDVTEKGIIGASYEFAQASQTSIKLFRENILVDEEPKQVCQLFSIDPEISVAAGSLLIACRPTATSKIIELLQTNHIAAAHIGKFQKEEASSPLRNASGENILYPTEDPYWSAYFNAFKNGLS